MVTLKQQQDTINDTTINKKQQTKSCVCLLLWTINVNKEARDAHALHPRDSEYDYSAYKEAGEKLFRSIDDCLKLYREQD